MFRNMATSLFKYDRIRTTDAKAKELRGWADHLVTLAKRGDLHARRQALSILREKDVVHRLFEEAPVRFADMSSGYTRIVKVGFRKGDTAPISIIELVAADKKPPRKDDKKSDKKKAAGAKKAKPAPPKESAESTAETT